MKDLEKPDGGTGAAATAEEVVIHGLPASGGIVIGPVYVYEREKVFVTERTLAEDEIDKELDLVRLAIDRADEELQTIESFAKSQVGEDAAVIFETQRLMLRDPELMKALQRRIRTERKNADFLIHQEMQKYIALLAASGDEYLRQRIEDLDEVGQRILRGLQEKRLFSGIEGRHIIVADNLTPADTILFTRDSILGYATDLGGITSHAAILARSLKLPAVVGLQSMTETVRTDDLAILDGQRGVVIVNPTREHLEEYEGKIERIRSLEDSLKGLADQPGVTPDGKSIELSANAEFVNEVEYIFAQGANGIGLYRTEHLYILKGDFPYEQEQYIAYSSIAHMMYPQPVIFRTFDIGGDKFLDAYAKEDNPFLGWRGIRLMLDKPEVFRHQLRAVLRASVMKNVRLMFPMISGLAELREAMKHYNAAREELRNEGIPFDEHMQVGIMIEVPSSVMIADDLAKETDFFSIGTNDLVQYLLAVDRNNILISDMYQEFHPSVLKAVKQIIDTGHANGIWVGMCGEMAGKPLATSLLLGLGLDEFSVVPSVIPEIKEIIRGTTIAEARELAEAALRQKTTDDVKTLLNDHTRRRYPQFFNSQQNGAQS
jgi:phosphoenolpyruvate-protein phosphotransferase (PTS system enzyme I)